MMRRRGPASSSRVVQLGSRSVGRADYSGLREAGTGASPSTLAEVRSVEKVQNVPTDPNGDAEGSQTLWMMLPPVVVARLSPNSRAQSHWPRTRARNEVMKHTALVARMQGLRPIVGPVEVTFRWIVNTRRRRDVDNLAGNGTVKAVLDALVQDRYLMDDSTEYVTGVHTEVVYEKGSRRLEIRIEPSLPDTW